MQQVSVYKEVSNSWTMAKVKPPGVYVKGNAIYNV